MTPIVTGQSTFATITGIVTDPAGAVIPAATIEVVHIQTSFTYTVQSNAEGQYTITNLRDGTYRLTARSEGFEPYRVESVIVTGRDNRRVDFPLSVGSVDTVITVEGGATLIETETARIADTKDREILRALPLTLRRAWDYFTMTPTIERTDGWAIRFGGTGNNQGEATIDGISVASAFGGPIGPLLDRTELAQEMRIEISSASAESQTMGQVALVSRAGTNDFHGTLADYYTTPAFRARNPFNNNRGTGRSHQLILSAGGPILIPKVYNGRNKTFLFHTTEIALGNGSNSITNRTVPLDAWRGGNFSGESAMLRNPFAGGDPFPNNQIPASMINNFASVYQERFMFRPNFGDQSELIANNFRGPAFLNPFVHQPTITTRFDHRISDKQFVYWRWTAVRWNFDGPARTFPVYGDEGYQQFNQRNMDTMTLSHTYTVSPVVSNEFLFGLSSERSPAGSTIDGNALVSELGLQGLAPNLPDVGGMPRVSFAGLALSGIDTRNECNPCDTDYVYHFTNNVSWFHNSHSFKFGVNMRKSDLEDFRQQNALFGDLQFSDRFTGHDYGDFLLGVPTTMQRAFPGVRKRQTRWSMGLFFTDEWKIRQNLTLTLGLRWDAQFPWSEANDLMSVFDIDSGKIVVPDSALSQVNPLMPLGYVDVIGASQAGRPERTLINADLNNFQPRLGLAWRPTGSNNTVIRGGWGLGYNISPRGASAVGVPFVISEPAFTNPEDDPLVLPQVFPSSGSGGPSTVSIPSGVQTDIRIAKYMQYSFTIEHQRWDTGFRATYNGANTRQGVWNQNINQPLVGPGLFIDKPRLFPRYPNIGYFGNGAGHQYHSLTVQAQRKMARGVHYQAFWTWAKDIGDLEDGGSPEDAHYRTREIGLVSRVPTHRFSANVVWELPFGAGRRWMNNSGRVVNAIFGGWRLATIASLETGRPLTPTWTGPDPTGTRFTGSSTRPNVTLRPDHLSDANIDNSTVERWFDAAAFGAPATGRFGTSAPGVIWGVPTQVMHNAISKDFRIRERATLRFEFLATNTLNHPNFAEPNTSISNVGGVGVITNVTDRNSKFDSAIPREILAHIRLEW
jgi:hypothetical protein